MLPLFTLFILFNKIITAQLSCDSLEFVFKNRRFQEPADVCYSTGNGEGTMLTCNQVNNDMNYTYFRDQNCNGNPYLTASVRDTMAILGIPPTNYTITCCTGQSCEYSIERTYATTSCSDDISTAPTWKDNINIINGCSGFFDVGVSTSITCLNNTTLIKKVYASKRTCEGTSETKTIVQNQCNPDGTQIGIICGIAPLTCIITTSHPTIDPTTFPTKQPTKHPTIDPTSFPTTQPTEFTTTTQTTETTTIMPTETPTKIHTNMPTNNPTQQPIIDSDSSDSSHSSSSHWRSNSSSVERDSSDSSSHWSSHSMSHSSSHWSSNLSSVENDSSDSVDNETDTDGDRVSDVYEYGDEHFHANKIKRNEWKQIMAITFVGVTCFVIMSGLILSSCIIYRKRKRGHIKVNSVEMDEDIEEEVDMSKVKHEEILDIISTK